jgi:hypothetical protein
LAGRGTEVLSPPPERAEVPLTDLSDETAAERLSAHGLAMMDLDQVEALDRAN